MKMHYNDVVMGSMASQITSLTIVYSAVYSGADQRKHQSSASLAFVSLVNSLHKRASNTCTKGPVTRKMFPFDDVIMSYLYISVPFHVLTSVPCERPQHLGLDDWMMFHHKDQHKDHHSIINTKWLWDHLIFLMGIHTLVRWHHFIETAPSIAKKMQWMSMNNNSNTAADRCVKIPHCSTYMMTSSNGNIFHVTGPLCVEFTGHGWIPRTHLE